MIHARLGSISAAPSGPAFLPEQRLVIEPNARLETTALEAKVEWERYQETDSFLPQLIIRCQRHSDIYVALFSLSLLCRLHLPERCNTTLFNTHNPRYDEILVVSLQIRHQNKVLCTMSPCYNEHILPVIESGFCCNLPTG